jgi:hypothetical protein
MLPHPVFKVSSNPDVELALLIADIDVPDLSSFHSVFPNDKGANFVSRLYRYG